MPLRVADIPSFQVFAEWRQNVPKWLDKLSSLIIQYFTILIGQ